MHTIDHISLRFEDNGRYHHDMFLRIGEDEWRCDSYYFLIDHGILHEQADSVKVRAVLARLMDQWRAAIVGLAPQQCVYLPYDFSDQSTLWLRCEMDGDMIIVHRGWSDIEGWSFLPSDVGAHLNQLPSFNAEGKSYTISREAFVRSISSTASTT
jgi:hypothetical protein